MGFRPVSEIKSLRRGGARAPRTEVDDGAAQRKMSAKLTRSPAAKTPAAFLTEEGNIR